jgi:hypothetical protein
MDTTIVLDESCDDTHVCSELRVVAIAGVDRTTRPGADEEVFGVSEE